MSPRIEDVKEITFGIENRESENLSAVLREVADWLDNHDIMIKDILITTDTEFSNWYATVYFDNWWLDKAKE